MSFRLFVYYCALCGGCMAYFGWLLGRLVPFEQQLVQAALKGFFLGVLVAFGLGIVDAFCSLRLSQLPLIALRAVLAGAAGALGGLFGGLIGQLSYWLIPFEVVFLPGWILTGFLIGFGVAGFDLAERLIRREKPWGAVRKLLHSVLGGMVGGLLGGCLYVTMDIVCSGVFGDQALGFWTPSAWGFVALGLCIGLFIGLAQIILKEAWIRVESGFRSGRELLLSKEVVTIGRGEGCDIALFGDSAVEKLHAHLHQRDGGYVIADTGTPGGTYVNDRRITGETPLRDGDAIRVGKCVLRFGEKRKQAA